MVVPNNISESSGQEKALKYWCGGSRNFFRVLQRPSLAAGFNVGPTPQKNRQAFTNQFDLISVTLFDNIKKWDEPSVATLYSYFGLAAILHAMFTFTERESRWSSGIWRTANPFHSGASYSTNSEIHSRTKRRRNAMKIRKVIPNNRRKAFEVYTYGKTYLFPYAVVHPKSIRRTRLLIPMWTGNWIAKALSTSSHPARREPSISTMCSNTMGIGPARFAGVGPVGNRLRCPPESRGYP